MLKNKIAKMLDLWHPRNLHTSKIVNLQYGIHIRTHTCINALFNVIIITWYTYVQRDGGKKTKPLSTGLLVHLHGGGFVAQSSLSHEVSLML